MTPTRPAYKHDCEGCVFVGADAPQPGERAVNQVDMWVHPNSHYPSLIRRYSSEPADYASMPWDAVRPPPEKYLRVYRSWRR